VTRWLVIGGGSAGCVVAARLSEHTGNEVTLLEAGPDHGESAGDAGTPLVDDQRLTRPATMVVRRVGAAAEPYLLGFGLGGSSLVNGAVVVGDPASESAGHLLPIEPVTELGQVARAVLASSGMAAPVGLVGRGGRRVSAADVYLRPAMGRENLHVVCDATVARVVFEGRRAVGVVAADGREFAADRVVLCAGAIGTPTLLLRSGADTPGIGVGLQDHLGFAISFDLLHPSDSGVAIGVTVEQPDRQLVVLDRLPDRPDMGALVAGFLTVASEGRVTVPDPAGSALVELAQLSVPADLDGLVTVTREGFELLAASALRAVIGDVYVDAHGTAASAIASDEEALRAWLPDHLGGYHHLAGSCRLGVAIDEDGGLHGYERLSVCDASALQGVPLRNPYVAVIRLAERMAASWVT
jgi:choline dehydrogenase-like flavoprotein